MNCKIQICDKQVQAKELCFAHYQRQRRKSKVPMKSRIRRSKSLATDLPEYSVWQGMKRRCSPNTTKQYPRYSGRGIKVCERWLEYGNGFDNFLADIGLRPSSKHQIDRIDNDGDYEPSNCRWVVSSTNSLNRDSVYAKSGYHGIDRFADKWRAAIVVNQQKIYIGLFNNIDEAAWRYDQWSIMLRDSSARLNLDYI